MTGGKGSHAGGDGPGTSPPGNGGSAVGFAGGVVVTGAGGGGFSRSASAHSGKQGSTRGFVAAVGGGLSRAPSVYSSTDEALSRSVEGVVESSTNAASPRGRPLTTRDRRRQLSPPGPITTQSATSHADSVITAYTPSAASSPLRATHRGNARVPSSSASTPNLSLSQSPPRLLRWGQSNSEFDQVFQVGDGASPITANAKSMGSLPSHNATPHSAQSAVHTTGMEKPLDANLAGSGSIVGLRNSEGGGVEDEALDSPGVVASLLRATSVFSARARRIRMMVIN
jgi:hypothetical protein